MVHNTDGAVQVNLGKAAIGGVLRDENGDLVLGYNKYLGKCSILDAELWGIFEGLKIIQRRGHSMVDIQSDSLEEVKAIQGGDPKTPQSALFRRIYHISTQKNS